MFVITENIMKRPVFVGENNCSRRLFRVINVCSHGEHYETSCICRWK